MTMDCPSCGCPEEAWTNDARLGKAAHDLLEALRIAELTLIELRLPYEQLERERAIIRAAIAKATERTEP